MRTVRIAPLFYLPKASRIPTGDSSQMNAAPSPLKVAIFEITSALFAGQKSPVPLARIGQLLAQQVPDFKSSLNGMKLHEFIAQELSEEILLTHKAGDLLSLLASPKNPKEASTKQDLTQKERIRYHLPFWAAFAKRLPENHIRILRLTPKVTFDDIMESDPIPTDALVIQREFILDPAISQSKPEENNRIFLSIGRWLANNPIDSDLVIAKPKTATHTQLPALNTRNESLLHSLINSLTPDELKRVAIPLDVAKKLMGVSK